MWASVQLQLTSRVRCSVGTEADDRLLEHPIRAGEELFGTIVVRLGADALDEEADIAIERAVVAIALRQFQARAVAEAHEGFAAVSLEELISGQVTDADALADRTGRDARVGSGTAPGRAAGHVRRDAARSGSDRIAGPRLRGPPGPRGQRHRLGSQPQRGLVGRPLLRRTLRAPPARRRPATGGGVPGWAPVHERGSRATGA